jgi:ABC-type glutathione transport system ATPase component
VVEQALLEAQLGPAPATPYSHQLSGGQKQQVAIARAFVARPAVVICDEIVSGEDVSEHAALLELVRTMERDHATALLFISHDLAAVRPIAHYVYVIRRDRIQEEGPTDAIFDHPWNAYARRLLEAVLGPAVHDVGGRTSAA